LAETPLLNKNNADWVLDEATQRMLPYRERLLERLGDQLLAYYEKKIAAAKMTGKALAGDVMPPTTARARICKRADCTWMYLPGRPQCFHSRIATRPQFDRALRPLSTTPGTRWHIKAALKTRYRDVRHLHIAASRRPCPFFPQPPVTFASGVFFTKP